MVDIADHPRDGAWPQLARARETAILHHSVDRRSSEPRAEFDLRQSNQSRWRLHFIGHVLLQQDGPFWHEPLQRRQGKGSLEAVVALAGRRIAPSSVYYRDFGELARGCSRLERGNTTLERRVAATFVAATRRACADQSCGEMRCSLERLSGRSKWRTARPLSGAGTV